MRRSYLSPVLLLEAIGLLAFAFPAQRLFSQTPAGRYDPVAEPAAMVQQGHARFTVLTPAMIRMEWSVNGRFEDHASLVFLNRRLPVPAFTHIVHGHGSSAVLRLHTDALDLEYRPNAVLDGRFTAANLSVTLYMHGAPVTWKPGTPDTANLLGTTRTLDRVNGSAVNELIEPGLISRAGWAIVDDSTRPLFDSSDFSFSEGENSPLPWIIERPEITSTDNAYRKNVAVRTTISAAEEDNTLVVSIASVQGSYPGMVHTRGYELHLPGDWPPVSVTVNGQSIGYEPIGVNPGWHFEGDTLTTALHTPDFPVTTAVTIRVSRDPSLASRRAVLDGFPGKITRLEEAFAALQNNTPIDSPPDALTDAMQTGDRLSYYPSQAGEILKHFEEVLPTVANAIVAAEAVPDQKRVSVMKSFMIGSYTPAKAQEMLDNIRHRDAIARSAIEDIGVPSRKD